MNIRDSDTSYFIKLDNIDVNYISNLQFQHDGTPCPLWSASSSKNRGLDDFFEFSVMAERRNGSPAESIKSASDDTIGYPMYRCVICDIDIPKAFRNEHNSSGKHKTCIKIAEAVLQRIQSHLLVEDIKEIVQNSSYTYFCESCAVIVKNTDKTLHEASDAHQKAVLYDQYLNDFLNIYLNKDYLDRTDIQYLKPSHKDTKKNQPSYSFNDKTNETKTTIMNNQPLYHYNDKECDTKAIVKKIEFHGLNFDEADEKKPVTKKKPICVPTNDDTNVDANDLSSDDQESKLTLYPVQSRKQRKKLRKMKKLELKNSFIVEPKKGENLLKLKLDPRSLVLQQLKADKNASFSQKPSVDLDLNTNNVLKHEASNNDKNEDTNYIEINSKPIGNSHSIAHSDNIMAKEESISNESIYSSNNTINGDKPNENDVIDEQYHSFDDKEILVEFENSLIDEQYYSICYPNNSDNDKDVSIKIEVKSNDDSNSITDEEQSPTKTNKLAEDQNNEISKPKDSVVDYIMLVNSDEFLNVKTENKKDNKKDTILSASELEKYLKTVTTFSYEIRSVHKLKFLNEHYIEIQTLDQCTVTVKADNFNGFCSRDGRLQCRVCMVMVDEDPAEHIYNIDHIANVRAPLEDMHCFRMINNTFKHCIHCNDTFCNFDLHKLLESHVSALKDAMERSIPSKPVEPKKVGRTYCEPCNIYIDSHNFNSHTNGKPHKNNLSLFFTKETKKTENTPSESTDKMYCDQCKINVAAHKFSEHKQRHLKKDLVESNAKKNEVDKIRCEPCNMQIRKELFAAHMYGKNHKASVKLVNESKRLRENFCATCNIHAESLHTHLTGEYHKYHANKVNTAKTNNVDEIYWNYQLKVTDKKTVCRICNRIVTISPRNITEHLSGQAHKTNYRALLEKNKIKTVDDNFSCNACKIIINPTKEIDHVESLSHKNALTQFNTDKTFCAKCNIYMKTANFPDHACDEYHVLDANKTNNEKQPINSPSTSKTNYQIKITANETICRVCNVKVPNRDDNITEHIKGKAHKTNYNALLDKNKIKMVNKQLFCEVCKTTVKSAEEIDHIEMETHKCALDQFGADPKPTSAQKALQPTRFHCEICGADVGNTLTAIEEHENDFAHRFCVILTENVLLRLDPLHYHLKKLPDSVNMVACNICKVNISTEHSQMHLESPAHNFKFRSTLNEHKMLRKNNGYFCQFCSTPVNDREALMHMQSLMHLYQKESMDPPVNSECNLPIVTTGYRCQVCQVDVPNNPKNITIHERGSSHVAKLRNLSFDDEQKVLMQRTANAREVQCSLCKVTVPVTGIKEHVKGARHVRNKVNATEQSTST